MANMQVSLPFAVDLTKERDWNSSSDEKHTFWVARVHFNLRERQVDDFIKRGNKLAAVESPVGVTQEQVHTIKKEITSVKFRETFQEALRQDESVREFVSTLAAGIGSDGTGKLTSEIKTSAQNKLCESFKKSYRIHEAVTNKVEETYQIKYTVDSTVAKRLVAVAAYQRYAYDLYLTWVDYLTVHYRRTAMGLRKKRTKRPVVNGRNHSNWIKLNVPFASAYFWKPLPMSSLIVPEEEYQNEVENPAEIEFRPPENLHRYVALKPEAPTLYQISNVAFPLKWIDRKGEWTEDELKKLEEEEAEGSAWYWEYGPGRGQSKGTA